ncbi:hypothetical protein [Bombiscardovia coagulans]|uniref:Protein kinase domain-containing protein n=1 Tax=Bombiscardovia coagulans TaxID=686666 RepID=A0A261EW20_9BIFI|nr:hypothetical protein [Bombiscardovia coagulans]OZG50856.1 hypothetical protein BOCO_0042 [Bombiscardovia coagulans]
MFGEFCSGPAELFGDESDSVTFASSFVNKHVSQEEIEGYEKITGMLNAAQIRVCGQPVLTPAMKVINHQTIKMEFIDGTTVENLLLDANPEVRFYGAIICFSLVDALNVSGIGWLDFAPRNIIMQANKNRIMLVDFERNVVNTKGLCPNLWVHGHPIEEIAALVPESTHFISSYNLPCLHSKCSAFITDCLGKSSRRKKYCQLRNSYSKMTYLEADQKILQASHARCLDDMVYYPSKVLDKVQYSLGLEDYWQAVQLLGDNSAELVFNNLCSLSKQVGLSDKEWISYYN